jgi:hypothetical protein
VNTKTASSIIRWHRLGRTRTPSVLPGCLAHVIAISSPRLGSVGGDHRPLAARAQQPTGEQSVLWRANRSAGKVEHRGEIYAGEHAAIVDPSVWQEVNAELRAGRRTVRGFLSTASRKRGVTIESFKNGKGERIYRVKK